MFVFLRIVSYIQLILNKYTKCDLINVCEYMKQSCRRHSLRYRQIKRNRPKQSVVFTLTIEVADLIIAQEIPWLLMGRAINVYIITNRKGRQLWG